MKPTLDLKDVRLRANPAYEIVLYDRLDERVRRPLQALGDDPDCYGVLRPLKDSTLSLKSVSRDTALLLFSLRTPGPLPRYVARSLGDDCISTIARMVLDGVLEMEWHGEMISGPAAYAYICGAPSSQQKQGALAVMSRRAIEYAAALELDDPLTLSARLYRYNSVPASRRWRSIPPGDDATADYLGLLDGPEARSLAKGWMRLPESPVWLSWGAKSDGRKRRNADEKMTYKLYVSPACAHMREAVRATADIVAQSAASQWKVGKGAYGLLRPDKIVVYFQEFTDLQEAALSLTVSLEGLAPQGVPFTAELGGAGMLSWGIDPQTEGARVSWLERESWRVKICNRLSLALIQARSAGDAGAVSPGQFALQRLRLEGIDTDTWSPIPTSAGR